MAPARTRHSAKASSSSTLTVVYPPGCREISDSLHTDELVRRLKTLAHHLQSLDQAEDDSSHTELLPLAHMLATEEFLLSHDSRDVQLLNACCIADLLRIFAPKAPYKDSSTIKSVFLFLISQLSGLKDPKDPAFKRYFYLLENVAYVKSFNKCLDLEECNEIFAQLFTLFFKIVNDEHSSKVKHFMLEVLVPLVIEADFIITDQMLEIILANLVEPNKSKRRVAYELAKDLVSKTTVVMEPCIQNFMNQTLILNTPNPNLSISSRAYDLIYELNSVSPKLLLTVLPQLEFKLRSTDEAERLSAVSLLARMFSEKGSTLAQSHRQLWTAFLGRYNDISASIRTKCVQFTMHFLLNHPALVDEVVDNLKQRHHDPDEGVRYEVVMAVVATARRDIALVSGNTLLLDIVKERTLDKKFKIRKEALSGLGLIYKNHLLDPLGVSEETRKNVGWIKNKILHGYYMTNLEDRLLVERLLNNSLVPFNLSEDERMHKLLALFTSVDDNATKAFSELQKQQNGVRKTVIELVRLHRQLKNNKDSDNATSVNELKKEIQMTLRATSKHLLSSVKAIEFLRKFSQQLLTDTQLLEHMERVVDVNVTCHDCTASMKLILNKLGPQVMNNLYFSTVKQLLERVSSVMIDAQSLHQLVDLVTDAIDGGPILQKLNLEPSEVVKVGQRGLRLLLVLSHTFPAHFMHPGSGATPYNTIEKLTNILEDNKEDYVSALTLNILASLGRHHTPLESRFPEVTKRISDLCKKYINKGPTKAAKYAVRCLFYNTTNSQDSSFESALDIIKANLESEKGESYISAIVALGHVALNLPRSYPIHIKNVVSRKIVKELIMRKREEVVSDDREWVETNELPFASQCVLEGFKMMARWLIGLKDDEVNSEENDDSSQNSSSLSTIALSAQKTFRMLAAIINSQGDLLQDQLTCSEQAWLRLGAGCAMLKICRQKGVGDHYSLDQYYTLSSLFYDPVPQVRERIVAKLHHGLLRSYPGHCLPAEFLGMYGLAGLESESRLRKATMQFMAIDINKRKEFAKSLLLSGNASKYTKAWSKIYPDSMLMFAVALLAHWPGLSTHTDVEGLKQVRDALAFVLDQLVHRNDNFSYGFYKAMIEKMKNHRDNSNPEDEDVNKKLWAVCDLAMGALITKTSNFALKEFPCDLHLPPLIFAPPVDSKTLNMESYLPPELIVKLPKKAMGVAAGLPTVTQVAKKTHGDTTATASQSVEEEENEERDGNKETGGNVNGDSTSTQGEPTQPSSDLNPGVRRSLRRTRDQGKKQEDEPQKKRSKVPKKGNESDDDDDDDKEDDDKEVHDEGETSATETTQAASSSSSDVVQSSMTNLNEEQTESVGVRTRRGGNRK